MSATGWFAVAEGIAVLGAIVAAIIVTHQITREGVHREH
jgi:hypothetical protein